MCGGCMCNIRIVRFNGPYFNEHYCERRANASVVEDLVHTPQFNAKLPDTTAPSEPSLLSESSPRAAPAAAGAAVFCGSEVRFNKCGTQGCPTHFRT
jgi:hypothetical protein